MQFYQNGFRPGDPDVAQPLPDAGRRDTVPDEVDVLIVGCGPAGLTLAAQMAAFPDIRTAIVERKDGPLDLGQAIDNGADLTAEKLADMLDAMAQGEVPVPGPQNGRFSSEPLGGPVVLTEGADDRLERNASVTLALDLGDTLKRIDGTEVPLLTPWQQDGAGKKAGSEAPIPETDAEDDDTRSAGASVDDTGIDKREAPVHSAAEVAEDVTPAEQGDDTPDTARGQSMQDGSDTGAGQWNDETRNPDMSSPQTPVRPNAHTSG